MHPHSMIPSEHRNDLNHEPQPFQLPSPIFTTEKQPPSTRLQRLQHLDSSETIPSEHTSIYDAERVGPEKDESLEKSASDDEIEPDVSFPSGSHFSPVENIPPLVPRSTFAAETAVQAVDVHFSPTGRWPQNRLGTITERLSQRTGGTSLSRSRGISSSVDLRAGDVAMTKPSLEHSKSKRRTQRRLEICHRRSFSLNDLDCLQVGKKPKSTAHDSSSSSGEALRAACLCDVYPIKPRNPPPERVPTPPGLPSFGTREAIEYRMPTPPRASFMSLLRSSRIVPNTPESSCPSGQPTTETVDTSPTLTQGIKRLLGITSIVTPIPQEPRRAALPHYLARADDGTFVRGRFGARHSAHGIGRGPLDAHPFHRDSEGPFGLRQTSLERTIQEIDKACAESEARRVPSLDPQGLSPVLQPSRTGRSVVPSQRELTIAEILSQNPLPSSPVNAGVGIVPSDVSMRSRPSLTFDHPGSGASIRSQSTTAGIDGVRNFIQRGERVSREQNHRLIKQKEQRSGCANCWFAFCVCCCDLDDPDRDIVDASRVMSPNTGMSSVYSPGIRPLRVVYEQPRSQRMVY